MTAIGILMGIILFALPAVASGWYYKSWRRGFIVAAASVLGPVIGVLLFRLAMQALVRPTGEDTMGWNFVAVGFGGPIGWLAGVFGSAIVFARRDRNLKPKTSRRR
jgi:hypothetical protein